MSQEPITPRPPVQKPPASRRLRKKHGEVLGLAVLGLGLLAFVSLGYVAYAKFTRSSPAPVQESEASLEAPMRVPTDAPAAAPKDEKPSFSEMPPAENMLEGNWHAGFTDAQAYLQMKEGAFQLIYTQGPEARYRKYARGTYTYDQSRGVLTLKPQRSFGEPAAAPGVAYDILTMRTYNVFVGRDAKSGDLFWAAQKEGTRRDKIHTLFLITNSDGAIRWGKSK